MPQLKVFVWIWIVKKEERWEGRRFFSTLLEYIQKILSAFDCLKTQSTFWRFIFDCLMKDMACSIANGWLPKFTANIFFFSLSIWFRFFVHTALLGFLSRHLAIPFRKIHSNFEFVFYKRKARSWKYQFPLLFFQYSSSYSVQSSFVSF